MAFATPGFYSLICRVVFRVLPIGDVASWRHASVIHLKPSFVNSSHYFVYIQFAGLKPKVINVKFSVYSCSKFSNYGGKTFDLVSGLTVIWPIDFTLLSAPAGGSFEFDFSLALICTLNYVTAFWFRYGLDLYDLCLISSSNYLSFCNLCLRAVEVT